MQVPGRKILFFDIRYLYLRNIARNVNRDSNRVYPVFCRIFVTGLIGVFLVVFFRITED